MIKACIFDLDGTLSDTLKSIAFSGNTSLRKEGLEELPEENYKYYAGNGAAYLVRAYLKDTKKIVFNDADNISDSNPEADRSCCLNEGALSHDPHKEEDFQYYFDSYMAEFSKYCMHEVKPFKGIPELIAALKNRGIRLAVLSNKPDAQVVEVVAKLFGDGVFDAVYGQRANVKRKPAPDGALALAEEFGVKPEECMYFGDTDTDMLTGKAAGMLTVGVLWGFRDIDELKRNGADIIVSSPEEIMEYI